MTFRADCRHAQQPTPVRTSRDSSVGAARRGLARKAIGRSPCASPSSTHRPDIRKQVSLRSIGCMVSMRTDSLSTTIRP
jgi:hypothetical protein